MAGWSIQIAIYEKELASQLEGGRRQARQARQGACMGGGRGRRGVGDYKGTIPYLP